MHTEFKVTPAEKSFFISLGVSILIHAQFFKMIKDTNSFNCLRNIFNIQNESLRDQLTYINSCFEKMNDKIKTIQHIMYSDFELRKGSNIKMISELMEYIILLRKNLGNRINYRDMSSIFAMNCKISLSIKWFNSRASEYHPDDALKVPRIYIKEESNEVFSIMFHNEISFAIEYKRYYSLYSDIYYVNEQLLAIESLKELNLLKGNKEFDTSDMTTGEKLKKKEILDMFNKKIKQANMICSICSSCGPCTCHHDNCGNVCDNCKCSILERKCFICNDEANNIAMATFNNCWHSAHIKCLHGRLVCRCQE